MTSGMIEMGTMTTDTDEDIAAFLAGLTPAERVALDADAALNAAEAEVANASAEVDAARAVLAETSSAATRSRVARAQRAQAAAQEAAVLAAERYHRAAAAAGLEAEDQAESQVVRLQVRIRTVLRVAFEATGLYGQLAAVASASGSSQIGPGHAAALREFAAAARALTAAQDAAGWPKPSSDREMAR